MPSTTETISLTQALTSAANRAGRCRDCEPFYCDACGWEADVAFTADVVAFRDTTDGPEVLLITRKWAPFAGHLALPGGYVDPADATTVTNPADEVAVSAVAAAREAAEETRLNIIRDQLRHVGRYDATNRDPRGRRISNAFAIQFAANTTVAAGDDAATAEWVPLETALNQPMAFDHHHILTDAVRLLRRGVLDS
ncbi:NUDIX domain-containing protein [Stackebrandtia nassauensis]|uniref:NUDIX hydrolase n=1 Tax=Stackebrandtia nassauensis (strain DSM 44728 / CIP 108903 / NRRL B-16338 / NBRC 102104 / LLR-40K-21) TaxID=446470 RepID=D3Q405_STANL|nr:NUDIX domain-containing protein [Stackebrandtia nassauensis]ADD45890.1 NUDIX hydrolase [Stackebrandtia nassauensis DSM 44728]